MNKLALVTTLRKNYYRRNFPAACFVPKEAINNTTMLNFKELTFGYSLNLIPALKKNNLVKFSHFTLHEVGRKTACSLHLSIRLVRQNGTRGTTVIACFVAAVLSAAATNCTEKFP